MIDPTQPDTLADGPVAEPVPLRPELLPTLGTAARLLGQVKGQLRVHLAGCLSAAQIAAGTCVQCLRDQVEGALGEAAGARQLAAAAYHQLVLTAFQEAYSYGAPLGCRFPDASTLAATYESQNPPAPQPARPSSGPARTPQRAAPGRQTANASNGPGAGVTAPIGGSPPIRTGPPLPVARAQPAAGPTAGKYPAWLWCNPQGVIYVTYTNAAPGDQWTLLGIAQDQTQFAALYARGCPASQTVPVAGDGQASGGGAAGGGAAGGSYGYTGGGYDTTAGGSGNDTLMGGAGNGMAPVPRGGWDWPWTVPTPQPPPFSAPSAFDPWKALFPRWNTLSACRDLQTAIDTLKDVPSVTVAYLFGVRDLAGNPTTPVWCYQLVAGAVVPVAVVGQLFSELGTALVTWFKDLDPTTLISVIVPGDTGGPDFPLLPGVSRVLAQLRQVIAWSDLGLTADVSRQPDDPNNPLHDSAIATAADTVASVARQLADWLSEGLRAWGNASACFSALFVWNASIKALLGLFKRWLGDGLADLELTLSYAADYLCPTTIPSAVEANTAFLAGTIDRDLWRCWVRANNVLDVPAEAVLKAQRSRLAAYEVIQAWARGRFGRDEADRRLRELGYLEPAVRQDLFALFEQVPGPGDLVNFMLRDVFDPAVVNKFGYDDEFADKFQGQALVWAQSQGISTDLMRYHWRAHWQLPSAGQAFEMLHRLRPDVVGPELAVTADDVRRLLGVNDVLPFWRDRFLAVSYRPLTRRDAQRAYTLNAIDRKRVKAAFLDEGYAEKDADALVAEMDQIRFDALLKTPWVRLYEANGLSAAEATRQLTAEGWSEPDVHFALNNVSIRRAAARRQRCVKAIGRRYLGGELADPDATGLLIGQGLDAGQAVEQVAEWACERNVRPKQLPAAKACGWFKQGLITAAQLSARLVRLGYTVEDVAGLVRECEASAALARVKAARALAAEEAKLTQKQLGARQKAAAAVKATAKAAAAEKKAAARRVQAAQRALGQAAEKLADADAIPLAAAAATVNSVWRSLIDGRKYDPDFAAALLLQEARRRKTVKDTDFATQVSQVADAIDTMNAASAVNGQAGAS